MATKDITVKDSRKRDLASSSPNKRFINKKVRQVQVRLDTTLEPASINLLFIQPHDGQHL